MEVAVNEQKDKSLKIKEEYAHFDMSWRTDLTTLEKPLRPREPVYSPTIYFFFRDRRPLVRKQKTRAIY